MKTLYVSDLDGTLLRSDERTSAYTNETISALVSEGMMFSFATARSYHTSSKVTKGLSCPIPVIVHNGVMTVNNRDGSLISLNTCKELRYTAQMMIERGVYPIVYAFKDGKERFSYITDKSSQAQREFILTRQDQRAMEVSSVEELLRGEIFYLSCIDEPERLMPLAGLLPPEVRGLYQRDIYTGEQWLEVMSASATKANAALALKKLYGCDRLVVFGDAENDLDIFKAADEAYAVENACDELKAAADGVIGSNNEDAVAVWLEENFKKR